MAKDDAMPSSFLAALVREVGVVLQGRILNLFQRDVKKKALCYQLIDIRIIFRDMLLRFGAPCVAVG